MTTIVALGLLEAGLQRRGLAEVAPQPHDADARRSRACSRVSAANVPSVEPSSTKTTSHGSPSGSSADASSSWSSATLRSSSCTGTTTEITAVSVCARCAALLSIDEALRARARPRAAARRGAGRRSTRRPAACSPRTSRPPSTCRRSRARRWTASRCAPPIRPGRLPVVARIAAGLPATGRSAAGEAMEISTGGAVPDGADAVVADRDCCRNRQRDRGGRSGRPPARNVRPIGGDVRAGDVLLEAGTRARRGADRCARRRGRRRGPVRAPAAWSSSSARAPSCAHPASELGPGQIYESNGPMLAAALEAAGAIVERIGPITDDEESHRSALERGLAADVLVSSGGVSVGPHDLVRRILGELGVEEDFWGVAVRPGKPLAFGVRGADARLRSAGQPGLGARRASSCSCGPALLALQGAADPGPRYRTGATRLARCGGTRRATSSSAHDRGADAGGSGARAAERPGVAHDRPRGGADALVLVPRGEGRLEPGERVRYSRCARSRTPQPSNAPRSSRGTRPPCNRSRGPSRGIRRCEFRGRTGRQARAVACAALSWAPAAARVPTAPVPPGLELEA